MICLGLIGGRLIRDSELVNRNGCFIDPESNVFIQ